MAMLMMLPKSGNMNTFGKKKNKTVNVKHLSSRYFKLKHAC